MPGKKPSKRLIQKAAELRMSGSSWDTVAKAVGRHTDTVRRWPTVYPAIWEKAITRAEQQLLNETTAESVLTLRKQLRSADEKSSRDAAEKLIRFKLARTKQPQKTHSQPTHRATSDATRVVRYLESLSDAELEELIEQLTQQAVTRLSLVVENPA